MTFLCKRSCIIHNCEYDNNKLVFIIIIILSLIIIYDIIICVLLEKKEIIDAIFKIFFYYFTLFFHRKLNIYKRLCVIVKRFIKTWTSTLVRRLSASLVPL